MYANFCMGLRTGIISLFSLCHSVMPYSPIRNKIYFAFSLGFFKKKKILANSPKGMQIVSTFGSFNYNHSISHMSKSFDVIPSNLKIMYCSLDKYILE